MVRSNGFSGTPIPRGRPVTIPSMRAFASSLLILALAASTAAQGVEPPAPVAVFAELDGTWTGAFVGYDEQGRELYRIDVSQTYRTVSDTRQVVEIRDVAIDGAVTTGRGENIAVQQEDGSLTLRCRVEKSDGSVVEHAGRVVEGPDGLKQLIWHSREPGRAEVFRERVVEEHGEDLYLIDGWGRYGDSTILMAGRYRRVSSP